MQKYDSGKLLERAKKGTQKLNELYNKEEWKKIEDKPCAMYTMDVEGKLAARGVAEVKFPITEIREFLVKETALTKLNFNCKEFKCLEKLPVEGSQYEMQINYMRYEGKWPVVSDRDFVTVSMTQKVSDDKMIISSIDASDLYEVAPVKGKVRGQVIVGGYVLQKIEENTTRVYYLSCSDLKGAIPQMLINMVQKTQGGIAGRIQKNMQTK